MQFFDNQTNASHAAILAQREVRLATGLERVIPWETAKLELRQKIKAFDSSRQRHGVRAARRRFG